MQPWSVVASILAFLTLLALIMQYQDEIIVRELKQQERRIDRLTCIVIPETCKVFYAPEERERPQDH